MIFNKVSAELQYNNLLYIVYGMFTLVRVRDGNDCYDSKNKTRDSDCFIAYAINLETYLSNCNLCFNK